MIKCLLFSSAVFALASTALSAQNETLVLTGDTLPGLGVVDEIFDVAVNDAGDWVVALSTSSMSTYQNAVLRNGVVVLKPGDPIPGPTPGLTFLRASSIDIDAAGHWTWTSGDPSPAPYGSGAFLDTTSYAATGAPVGVPQITPGTTYTGIYDQAIGAADTLVVHGIMSDPAILGFQQSVLVSLAPQPGGGLLPTLLLKRGDLLPGSASPVQSLSKARQGLATNGSGQVLYELKFLDGVEAVYLDQVALGMNGQLSPVFGRVWGSLDRMPVALNDAGDFAFGGRLQGDYDTSQILVWNGIKLAQEGDSLPAIAPYALTDLGLGKQRPNPIQLTDSGQLLWFGAWDDPDPTRDSGLFLDQGLLLQEGVSAVDGLVIDEFRVASGYAPAFDISPDGETIALHVLLADGRTGAFLIRPAGAVETVQGCVPNLGTLTAVGPLKLGGAGAVTIAGAQSIGAKAFMFISTAGLGPCGVTVPGAGEVLIDLSPPNPILVIPELISGPPQTVAIFPTIPNDPLLFGFELHAQGLWVDAGAAPGVPLLRLTNALTYSIGL